MFKNSFGEAQSKCRLNVYPNNRHETRNMPIFLELLKDININVGQDVCFKCKVSGIPQPDVKWFKNGNPIVENNKIKVGIYKKIKLDI